jgi:hypothetical protein
MSTSLPDLNNIEALNRLQRAVLGSRIDTESPGQCPVLFVTIDGKRQVCCMTDQPGYDLWVPRRKKKIIIGYAGKAKVIDDTLPWKFGCTLEQAVAFLGGATKARVAYLAPTVPTNKIGKTVFGLAIDWVYHGQQPGGDQ